MRLLSFFFFFLDPRKRTMRKRYQGEKEKLFVKKMGKRQKRFRNLKSIYTYFVTWVGLVLHMLHRKSTLSKGRESQSVPVAPVQRYWPLRLKSGKKENGSEYPVLVIDFNEEWTGCFDCHVVCLAICLYIISVTIRIIICYSLLLSSSPSRTLLQSYNDT